VTETAQNVSIDSDAQARGEVWFRAKCSHCQHTREDHQWMLGAGECHHIEPSATIGCLCAGFVETKEESTMTDEKTLSAGKKYKALIESLTAVPPPPPISPEEETEILRLVKEARMSRAAAEVDVIGERPKVAEDKEDKYARQAVLRHRSYLPFVEAGVMTIYEAVREVGANRSADGRGQERT
jgi:hypothetical protein